MDDVLFLITTTSEQDKYGIYHEVEHKHRVFVRVNSITRAEFRSTGREGLNPEYEFTMFQGDFQDETELEYKGKRYSIYRTYHVQGSDDLELYVERKGGTNGPNKNNSSES